MNLRKGHEFVKNPLREDVWGILGGNHDHRMGDNVSDVDEDFDEDNGDYIDDTD